MSHYRIEDSLGFIVNVTARMMRQHLQQAFLQQQIDITAEQWGILSWLKEKDGQTQQEISAMSRKDKTTITRLISGLEKRGFIVRTTDAADRRTNRIRLTDSGRDVHAKLLPSVEALLRKASGDIPGGELQKLKSLLYRVCENLTS